VLGVDLVPDLYLTNNYEINAYAFGTHQPIIVLNSEILRAFDQPSLAAVIAHEVGHIHCDHVMYKNMAEMLLRLSGQVIPSVMTGLPVAALSLAFASWDRSSELSSDRAAAIVSQDPEAVCRMLMYLARSYVSENA
jgi:Zn-dependent protease with chaperone function